MGVTVGYLFIQEFDGLFDARLRESVFHVVAMVPEVPCKVV